MSTAQVSRWISDALKEEHFEKCEVQITGDAGKDSGYVGTIAFVTVTAQKNGEVKEYNLVIKYNKPVEGVQEVLQVRLLFEREILIYTTAIPEFKAFERQKNLNITEKLFAKCFGARMYDNEEVIILQDLKKIGYKLVDKQQPLDLNHLKISFECYGKWHALSYAYRDQRTKELKKLIGDQEYLFANGLLKLGKTITHCEQNLYDFLKKTNQSQYIEPLKTYFELGFARKQQEVLRYQEPRSVLLHGDTWSGNVMFHYDNSNETCPHKAIFIDFQVSGLGSPVLDLSYHLYTSASEKELANFEDLLEIYYASFSSTLKDFGSDPEKLFPYSKLVEHWKKYAAFGFVQAMFVLPIFFTDNDSGIHKLGGDGINLPLDNIGSEYSNILSRILAVVRHFVEFNTKVE